MNEKSVQVSEALVLIEQGTCDNITVHFSLDSQPADPSVILNAY